MKNIQDILPLVEQPSQYLGTEINCVRKAHQDVRLRIALAFPDMYEIGTSHFGIQILCHILNQDKDILAERAFAPGTDMEHFLRTSHMPLMSLESHTPLNCFDIVGFSLLYELNFTNILTMLDLAGIPFFASQRDNSFPLIIAGGPCTCNPEPVADFFDAIVVGDGENVIMEMARTWLEWKTGGDDDREKLLKIWSGIQGIYIPAFFDQAGDKKDSDVQVLLPKYSDYAKVARTIISDLDTAPFPDAPILPFGRPVHDRLRLEISRGCTRGCRFCQAGMIYRPVRERSPETLLDLTDRSLPVTGYEDMSLLSLSTGDYTSVVPLMECLMARCESEHVAVSFPSLRAGTLTPELMRLIKKVRKTGFTIAPEAGSQRLRDVINKNISEADILETVKHAFEMGWNVIKLYFMIGLPTERDEDLEAIAELVKKLGGLRKAGGKSNRKSGINVSVGTFIPKPHTPFQWFPQISPEESKTKIRWLQDKLRKPGIQFKWQHHEVSRIEGLFARGDRKLSRVLVRAYEKGCKFDGWSDKFQYHLWEDAFSDTGTDPDFYITRARDMDEPLPWDHVHIGVTKDFLKEEWERALRGEHTQDCRDSQCNQCGVCDFDLVAPKVFRRNKSEIHGVSPKPANPVKSGRFKKLKISYSKRGLAKYFGHLEMVSIFSRAIRRAGIPVKYSEGFHPMPKISFADPLPVGMESLNESMFMVVPNTFNPAIAMKILNDQLPEGFEVFGCETLSPAVPPQKLESSVYLLILKDTVFSQDKLDDFSNCSELILSRSRKGKLRKTDMKEMILDIRLLTPRKLEMRLKWEPGKTVRPADAAKAIFGLCDEDIRLADMIKIL